MKKFIYGSLFIVFLIVNVVLIYGIADTYSIDMEYIVLDKPNDNGNYFNNLSFPSNIDIADPYMLKVDDTYYLYSTSKNGIKITSSKDFKNWKVLTDSALEDKGNYSYFWAPEVYYYNNKYYMFYTGYPDYKILVAVADNPAGPFKNSKIINSKLDKVIDSNVFFDDDGKIYLYTKREVDENGVNNGSNCTLFVEELNDDLMSVKSSEPIPLLKIEADNTNNSDIKNYWERHLLEGPFVIKNNNKYYLMYSTGTYRNESYTVGYAVSDLPTSGFVRKTFGNGANATSSLLHGVIPSNNNYDSTKNIYGTGHHAIYKVNDSEMYIVYHSIVFENNVYKRRKINFDYIGFDNNGNLYVNGPSTINQPLPSGTIDLYKLDVNDYSVVNNGGVVSYLNDNINYNVNNSAYNMDKEPLTRNNNIKTNSIEIKLNNYRNIEDIWLYSDNAGFSDVTVDVIINNKYILKNIDLGVMGSAKIQIPEIDSYVKNIQLDFSDYVNLSEVNLYRTVEIDRTDDKINDNTDDKSDSITDDETDKKFNDVIDEKVDKSKQEILFNPKTGNNALVIILICIDCIFVIGLLIRKIYRYNTLK